MKLTYKQRLIMAIILQGEGRDSNGNLIATDLDLMLEKLEYKTSKQSLQFSIRALIRHDLIYKGHRENRRNRQRVLIYPTEKGKDLCSGSTSKSIWEPSVSPDFPEELFSPAASLVNP